MRVLHRDEHECGRLDADDDQAESQRGADGGLDHRDSGRERERARGKCTRTSCCDDTRIRRFSSTTAIAYRRARPSRRRQAGYDVEDCAELVFERVDDDDDCTNDAASVFGIEIVEKADIIGSLCHTGDRAPMLDSGSTLHTSRLCLMARRIL